MHGEESSDPLLFLGVSILIPASQPARSGRGRTSPRWGVFGPVGGPGIQTGQCVGSSSITTTTADAGRTGLCSALEASPGKHQLVYLG